MKTSFLILLLLAATQAAAAAAPDYSHLDLAYSSEKRSDLPLGTAGGYQLAGSYGFDNGLFLEAAYKHNRFEFQLANLPGSAYTITLQPEQYQVGGGYHYALNPGLDLVSHLDYADARTRFELGSISNTESYHGYLLGVGLRDQVTDTLELAAFVDHDNTAFIQYGPGSCGARPNCVPNVTWKQDGSETVLSVAGHYRFTEAFGLGLEYRHSSLQGGREWLLSGRWNF